MPPAWARESAGLEGSSSANTGASSSVSLKALTQPKRLGKKKGAFQAVYVPVDSGASYSVMPESLAGTLTKSHED